MPKSAGGLIGFILAAVVATVIGLYIINRVGFLKNLISMPSAASGV